MESVTIVAANRISSNISPLNHQTDYKPDNKLSSYHHHHGPLELHTHMELS